MATITHGPGRILRATADAVGLKGCGDSSCMLGPPEGMATNGGCRCHEVSAPELRRMVRQLAAVARTLASRLAELEADRG